VVGSFFAFVLSGCGGGPKLPPTAPVSGIVTLDDTPLPRGTVQFVPDGSQGTSGPPGVGVIDSGGRFEIFTAGVKGAVVGHHKVAVEAREEQDDLQGASWTESLIPDLYNDPETSGVTVIVKAGERNKVDIKLKSRP
jgi:hypothetical protein